MQLFIFSSDMQGPGGSMSYVIGLPNNSYKPITNTGWVRVRLCKLQKGALDSTPQVIKLTSCLPMFSGSLRVLRLLPKNYVKFDSIDSKGPKEDR